MLGFFSKNTKIESKKTFSTPSTIEIIPHEPVLILRDTFKTNPLLQTHLEITNEFITIEEEGVVASIPIGDAEKY